LRICAQLDIHPPRLIGEKERKHRCVLAMLPRKHTLRQADIEAPASGRSAPHKCCLIRQYARSYPRGLRAVAPHILYVYVYTHAHTHTHSQTHTHTRARAHTHTHIHTHTHTPNTHTTHYTQHTRTHARAHTHALTHTHSHTSQPTAS
jgi:hypothetical protein